ncbi:hypothetical protein QQF64_034429 [Cirrhinus molitorella]|uniref:Serpin domain-containing protein n=1 Tax=Cirrhinus molitorella TaxID=172907 RepID=A0ABR3L4Q7_9TELE
MQFNYVKSHFKVQLENESTNGLSTHTNAEIPEGESRMWLVPVILASLLSSPTLAGVKDLGSHFTGHEKEKVDARGLSPNGENTDMESIPLDFHRENTVTNDLPLEGLEDEDYIDFDKILAEGEDDYSEGDHIDEISTPAPDLDLFGEPSDPKIRRARLLRLFHGRTRLQRINVVNARFGCRLYRKLRNRLNQTDNILLAPVGISIAMGMMALGAGQTTQEQLYQTLGFGEFVNASTHYDNSTEAFRGDAKTYYFAEPQSVDFADPAFLVKANQRIQKITKGLIKESLKSVDPNMVVMLLNYLYFKGESILAWWLLIRSETL